MRVARGGSVGANDPLPYQEIRPLPERRHALFTQAQLVLHVHWSTHKTARCQLKQVHHKHEGIYLFLIKYQGL